MLDIHVVSHTHWDREWYLTYEQFRFRLVGLVDRLLDLIDAEPAYEHFHLDGQTIVLEDYLELRPEQEPRLRRADRRRPHPDRPVVRHAGRVSRQRRIARAQPRARPSHRAPVRHADAGRLPAGSVRPRRRRCRRSWRQFGLDNAILWRGFGGPDAEYWWEAPDGSRVLMMHLPPEGYCNATRVRLDPDADDDARGARSVDYERARTRTGEVLLMNGVDHVEPHPGIPMLVAGCRRSPAQRATPLDAAGLRRRGQARGRTATRPRARDRRRRAAQRRGLRQPAARRPFRARLSQAAERARADAARVVRRAARDVRLDARRALPGRRAAPRVEDAAAEPSARQHLRLQHRRGARGEHDALRPRAAGRRRCRRIGARGDCRLVPAPPPGALRASSSTSTQLERAQVVEAIIDLPSRARSPGAGSTRRRSIGRSRSGRATRRSPRSSARMAAASRFRCSAKSRSSCHVMSRYETPWALNVRRLHVAVVGAVAAAVRLCGVRPALRQP